jgi:hypothetical protein
MNQAAPTETADLESLSADSQARAGDPHPPTLPARVVSHLVFRPGLAKIRHSEAIMRRAQQLCCFKRTPVRFQNRHGRQLAEKTLAVLMRPFAVGWEGQRSSLFVTP